MLKIYTASRTVKEVETSASTCFIDSDSCIESCCPRLDSTARKAAIRSKWKNGVAASVRRGVLSDTLSLSRDREG